MARKNEVKPVADKKDKPVEFEVNREAFRQFVENVQCKGISDVSEKEKVTQGELFENCLLEAVKGKGIVVKATDTSINKVIGQHLLREGESLKVVTEGEVPVTNIKNLLIAIGRTGGDKKGRCMQVLYPDPDEANKIRLTRIGTETAFSFTTSGRGDITSLKDTSDIRHRWDAKLGCVISTSTKTKTEIPWTHKIIVVPAALRELAKDVSSFVKQRVARMSMAGQKCTFLLGEATASKKGGRELTPITRKVIDAEIAEPDKDGWKHVAKTTWKEAGDDAEKVEAKYYHGFYAVIQSLEDSLQTELHWGKIPGLGDSWYCWVHAENALMELNYMVPYDK
jgi:hypothetical protein